jgi:hypothetical protein
MAPAPPVKRPRHVARGGGRHERRVVLHNLGSDGLTRPLAPGITARIFPGVNALLSVVTLERIRNRPCTRNPTNSGACAWKARGSGSRTVSSIP